MEADGPFGVGVWKGILKGQSWFQQFINFKVDGGSSVRFWLDKWTLLL